MLILVLKGTGHDFCWSGKPVNHFQKLGKLHFKTNNKIPINLLKLWGKTGFLANFILEGTLTVFLISYNFSFIMCDSLERKEIWSLELKNIIYAHNSVIKNGKVHHWSLKARFAWFISRNTLLNLFMPSQKWIQTANIWLSNTQYVISAGLLW